ncbi:hypothetical protein M011DRAFT_244712 [Sporormia fimetaria CBS 119925]|uniref:Uncharacterized protein n=1 Tax=Sporormia fimetaria CBS 119925 TaxID=1340428 RepID=A0A6A6VK68_9PLEO|nr:hypothetical protein M011DRAFT_244712 [Sporormia fimetaria CBS 119925]
MRRSVTMKRPRRKSWKNWHKRSRLRKSSQPVERRPSCGYDRRPPRPRRLRRKIYPTEDRHRQLHLLEKCHIIMYNLGQGIDGSLRFKADKGRKGGCLGRKICCR